MSPLSPPPWRRGAPPAMPGWSGAFNACGRTGSCSGGGCDGAGGTAGVKGLLPEATYLSWLDFRAAGLGDNPARKLVAEARVKLSDGPAFGPGGAGFARLNFATTPAILDEILSRVVDAIERTGGRLPPPDEQRLDEHRSPQEVTTKG